MRPALATLLAVCAFMAASCESVAYREVTVDLGQRSSARGNDGGTAPTRVLRVSVASMESPRDTYSDYSRLFGQLANRLDVELSFIQRRTYSDVNRLLEHGGLDAALICSGGYVALTRRAPGAVEIAAVPVVRGLNTYRSLILVPASSPAKSLADLAGKRFALADELSLTGRGYPVQMLKSIGQDPTRFFSSTLSTGAHDRSIIAVARGLVDGAAVNSLIYDHQVARDPSLAERTRIIHRSPAYGMPPLVMSTQLSPDFRARLRQVLLTLGDDAEGAEALRAVHFDHFAEPPPGLFESAAQALEAP